LLLELFKEGFKEVGKENELGPKHHEQLAKQKDKLIRIQDMYIDGELSKEGLL
jgi:hypothetical protein